MTLAEQLQTIESLVNEVLKEEPQFFLISFRIKPINNIKLFLDADAGLPIEKCVYFNKKIYKLIEEAHLFPEGDFSLEVSSPGVDEPLKSHRQYTKNVGRIIEVVFKDDTTKTGKLLQVADADFIIEETIGKGKKMVVQQTLVPFENIKTTTVQIHF
ncbi:MAG: ribosome maturation factor [Bacteroidota bacterium]|nr:ribosome maturation factor [Bacteroidota bacterium]